MSFKFPQLPNPPVFQSGTVTPTHVAVWTSDGVIQDGGPNATAGPPGPQGPVGPAYTLPLALNDVVASSDRVVLVETSGVARWTFGGDSEAEIGANYGCAWELTAFSDTGVSLGYYIRVDRATGQIQLPGAIVTGPLISNGGANYFYYGGNSINFYAIGQIAGTLAPNGLIQNGDMALIFNAGTANSGSAVIGPNTTLDYGIRLDSSGNIQLGAANIGFFTTAPIAKPAVTGSRASGAALTSLLTELAALGLITNSTTT